MQGKDKVQAEDFRKAIPDATMGWVLFQPAVKPFFVCGEDGAIFVKAPGFKTRYYAIESAAHAKALANRIFWYAIPTVLLLFSTWFMTDVILVYEAYGWKLSLWFVPPLLALACFAFGRWRLTRNLRPHFGGPYRTVTDDEFRDILRERGRVPHCPEETGQD